ncbi:helix-turn-helix domain-containing protein [Streptomyces boninensis]|uniref:TetR/AcrR family transcriptional regulator n=1 Tax=Streptomyces boninensis TaxID=2039455 RepID=UPI003B20FD4C
MARWEPNARGRLEQAALELYSERGYDATTVKEIAQRAGLTERTFFRHFADKREVLFGGTALQDGLVAALAEVRKDAEPLDAVAAALEAAGEVFDERRELVKRRQAIIAAHAELQERELIKLAAIGAALAGALRERGAAEPAASLAAEVGVAVFKVAYEQWLDGSDARGFTDHLREGFTRLQTLTASA